MSGASSPHAAASHRQVASFAAIACGPSGLRIHVKGALPEGSSHIHRRAHRYRR
jgi:hypothetical protein